MTKLEISRLCDMLRRCADDLAKKLLPGGKYEGAGEYRCSADASPTGEAISVHVGQGAKQGIVGFWGSGKGGDMLDLIEHVEGCNRPAAIEFAKSYLGFGHSREWLTNWKTRERNGRVSRSEQTAERRKHRLSTASGIWKSSGPLGGIAHTYLASRGINPLVTSDSLRLHAGLPHPEGGHFPAIVARVVDSERLARGVWRIFLKHDGSGKAPVSNPKLGLGESAGCAVRLGGDAESIGIAEGIETALACMQLASMPVWSALSAAGIASFIPPPGIKSIIIFADNDQPKFAKNGALRGNAGMEAAEKLKERMQEKGIKCKILAPPEGKDWLDVLNETKEKK